MKLRVRDGLANVLMILAPTALVVLVVTATVWSAAVFDKRFTDPLISFICVWSLLCLYLTQSLLLTELHRTKRVNVEQIPTNES